MNDLSFKLDAALPQMAVIKEVLEPAEDFRTFLFDFSEPCLPGQFFMIWLPGINEKPFTVSYAEEGRAGITVQLRGDFTRELFRLRAGDMFGVRGPYGNGYRIDSPDNACVVTGGSGSAAVLPLIKALREPLVIIGARSSKLLLYKDLLPDAHFVTDDGSYGAQGLVTDSLLELLGTALIRTVYTCGPERMIRGVIDICMRHEIRCQFSLERYMKCGFGVCGQCTCGKKRVCADGPVFSIADLPDLSEFGLYARTKTGGRTPV
jgi:dihydroorotate dehydrogenase electron transfer subunit